MRKYKHKFIAEIIAFYFNIYYPIKILISGDVLLGGKCNVRTFDDGKTWVPFKSFFTRQMESDLLQHTGMDINENLEKLLVDEILSNPVLRDSHVWCSKCGTSRINFQVCSKCGYEETTK